MITRANRIRNKKLNKITCIGCEYDPTTKEQMLGIVCKGPDQTCLGKAPKKRLGAETEL